MSVIKMDTTPVDRPKILLAALPFWTPMIPSQGIAALKGFLQRYGYRVKAVDAAADSRFLEYYKQYFDVLRGFIPGEKRGNFYNIGHDVLRNHMMAFTNYRGKTEYMDLVKDLVYKTYYCTAGDDDARELNAVVEQFYARMEDYFLRLLDEEKPSVLGLSVNSGNLPTSKFVFELTRKHHPYIQTVMGGCVFFNHLAVGNPDLDTFMEKTESYIDKMIIGKGEVLFLKLLRGELPESQRLFTRDDVTEEEIASYPLDIPDLSDYDLERYFYQAASASSSCPFKCSFCNAVTFFGKYKKKDISRTVDEMARLQEKFGHRLFFMTDSLLNPVITDLSKRLISEDLRVYMDGYFIVDDQTADLENTLLWRRGGFYRARLGVESGSQDVLNVIGKNITPKQIKAAVSSLAMAGIKTTTYWVIGHPGETEEDFRQTLALLEELKNDIWQAECNPFTYFYTGQAKGDEWAGKRRLLYPESAGDMLLSRTWVLDCEPSRRECYDRVFRFVEHCKKLGIPNPYSADEIYHADERWKRLHKNAVPPLVDLIDNKWDRDDRENVKMFVALPGREVEEGDFDF